MDLPVKAAGTQQCRIQNIRTVGGCQDNDTIVAAKAVHLYQHLIQGLFLFVVTASQTGATLTTHSIDLIDENNRRCDFLGLVKQVPDTAGTNAHIQLHKIGTGNGQKLHTGLPCHRTGQQGLTGTGRAYQQNAVGNSGTDTGIFFRIPQEIHHFL